MKTTLMLAALLSLPVAAGVYAEEASMPKMDKEAHMHHMKEKMEKRHQEHEQRRDDRRAAWDKHHDDCKARMQAATTPEAMKAVREGCKAEGKHMHEGYKAKREEMKAKYGEMKTKRMEMREKRTMKREAPAGE